MKLLDKLIDYCKSNIDPVEPVVDENRLDYIVEFVDSLGDISTNSELRSIGISEKNLNVVYWLLQEALYAAIYDSVGDKPWDKDGWDRTCRISRITSEEITQLAKVYPNKEIADLSYDQIIQVIGK